VVRVRGLAYGDGPCALAERVRAVSSRPVSYAELPGAYHDFDLYESIRSAAVSQAVAQFTARVSTSPA
jgi:acetyl esterase/lipase